MGFPINYQEIISNSSEETILAGKKLASFLSGGSIVALCGTLGSGKTYLVKGIASGLGIKENITSPTYTIINEYQIKDKNIIFYHIDLYRLEDRMDFEDINGYEIILSGGICVIEWSERVYASLPEEKISINIEITGDNSRLIKIIGSEKL